MMCSPKPCLLIKAGRWNQAALPGSRPGVSTGRRRTQGPSIFSTVLARIVGPVLPIPLNKTLLPTSKSVGNH